MRVAIGIEPIPEGEEISLMVGFRCIAGNADIGIWECIRDPAFLIFCYHRVTARIYLCV